MSHACWSYATLQYGPLCPSCLFGLMWRHHLDGRLPWGTCIWESSLPWLLITVDYPFMFGVKVVTNTFNPILASEATHCRQQTVLKVKLGVVVEHMCDPA